MPTSLSLFRIDPSRNMQRFYCLSLQPTLFGDVALVREWGRMGCRGRLSISSYDGANTALNALNKLAREKHRKGYRPG